MASHYFIKSHREISLIDNFFYSFEIKKDEDLLESLKEYEKSNWELLDKKNLPSGAGVYAFIVTDKLTGKNDFAYIGCSKNLNIRLYSHLILRFLTEMLVPTITSKAYFWKTEDYRKHEIQLIIKNQPFLNNIIPPIRFRIDTNKRIRNVLRRQYKNKING